MELLTIAIMGMVNIACFVIGAKVGQTAQQGRKIELPAVHPIEGYKAHQEKKQAQKEQERMDAIMRNMEAYDGTSVGQREVK